MPQTTVLIPAYNCGKFISDAINSVLKQSYSDYEILVIDDGSTDNTENVIKSIASDKIIYLKNDENSGIVKTLNKGIELARGKYIARMDADDIMLGNRLQLQIDFLEQNPDYGMVGGWYQIMDENGKFKKAINLPTDYELLKIGLFFFNQFAHPTVTMRSSLLKKLKYKQEFIYCEDFDLWTRFSKITKTANLPYYFLSYRWYDSNSCHTKQKELRTSVAELFSREFDELDISYTAKDLMLHLIVNFGWTNRLFIDEHKHLELVNWHNRIFESPGFKNSFNSQIVERFRKDVLPSYLSLPSLKKSS